MHFQRFPRRMALPRQVVEQVLYNGSPYHADLRFETPDESSVAAGMACEEVLMRKPRLAPSAPLAAGRPESKPEIDYAPKEYTLAQTLRGSWKFLAVAGIILLLVWLIEKFL